MKLDDQLENDIRELRGAEPAELAKRLVERGWTRNAVDPELLQTAFENVMALAPPSAWPSSVRWQVIADFYARLLEEKRA